MLINININKMNLVSQLSQYPGGQQQLADVPIHISRYSNVDYQSPLTQRRQFDYFSISVTINDLGNLDIFNFLQNTKSQELFTPNEIKHEIIQILVSVNSLIFDHYLDNNIPKDIKNYATEAGKLKTFDFECKINILDEYKPISPCNTGYEMFVMKNGHEPSGDCEKFVSLPTFDICGT